MDFATIHSNTIYIYICIWPWVSVGFLGGAFRPSTVFYTYLNMHQSIKPIFAGTLGGFLERFGSLGSEWNWKVLECPMEIAVPKKLKFKDPTT